ncbi:MAG: integrase [Hyphomicrobiales bacterium]|nr:MAG: integrase [Hyphomicrobiales bacterium]
MNKRFKTERRATDRNLANMNTVDAYVRQSLAPNSVAAYQSDLRHFRAWGGRIPATPQMVAHYIAEHASHVKASTLSRRMAAIASAHAQAGRPSPARSELVQSTLRGIRRVHGTAQRQAKPISIEMLRQMAKPRKDIEPVRDLRDRVLLVVGFAGGFRRSELAQLTPQSLVFGAQGVEVTLQRSKTDQQGKGRVVALPPGPRHLCPVQLLKAWLLVLRRIDPEGAAKPLFRRVDRYGQVGQGLRGAAVGGVLRQRLKVCGLEREGYSAHSLRSGLVTEAAKAGVPTWAIQRQTGHRSESTVHRYIREITVFERNAFASIAA